jgi:hypothetical protein
MEMESTVPAVPPDKVGDRFVTVFAGGTALTLAVMTALIIFLVLRNTATEKAAHNSTIAACQLSNTNRTEDIATLNAILALPAISSPQFITPAARSAQAADLARVRAQIRHEYALRNCALPYRTG